MNGPSKCRLKHSNRKPDVMVYQLVMGQLYISTIIQGPVAVSRIFTAIKKPARVTRIPNPGRWRAHNGPKRVKQTT